MAWIPQSTQEHLIEEISRKEAPLHKPFLYILQSSFLKEAVDGKNLKAFKKNVTRNEQMKDVLRISRDKDLSA